MSELLALAERCERSVGRDRELDVAITIATGVVDSSIDPRFVQNIRPDNDDDGWVLYEYENENYTDCAKSFTASIDAAMTLGDPAAEISISTLYGVARVEYPLNYADAPPCHGEHVGGLIAPAICAAILRAYAELAALRARAAEVRG